MKDAQLVERYEKLAEISGNAHHIMNAREHREVYEEAPSVYDRDATREGIKQVCALIAMEV